jgi:hypothetical protein
MKVNVLHLRYQLAKLRSGSIPEDAIYSVLHQFGESSFFEAKRDIEKYLRHDDPQLRYIALNVLTLHWKCSTHRETCVQFVLNDDDSENRRLGTSGLAALLEGTRDAEALRVLLQVFHNESEEWHVRDSAYSAILYILGRPVNEQPVASRKLDYSRDVRWELVQLATKIANDRK